MSIKPAPTTSLLTNIKQESEFFMYTHHNGSIISVPLSSQELTVEEAILDAL